MATNLESIVGRPLSERSKDEWKHVEDNPAIEYILSKSKDKKRRETLRKEIEEVLRRYSDSIYENSPTVGRVASLDQAYNMAPDEEELEGKDPKEVLRQRLYSNPGRKYQYVHGVVGNKKKARDIKYELGKTAQYTIKEGWPGLTAGAGWIWANSQYGAAATAAKYTAAKTAATGAISVSHGSTLANIGHFLNPLHVAKDVGTLTEAARETATAAASAGIWGTIATPLLYGLGAYATYKTIGYFLKRRREKKLEQAEIESMEKLQNDFRLQQQIFQPRIAQNLAA